MRSLLILVTVVGLYGCQGVILSRPSDAIRSYILKQTPVGSPMKEVEAWAKKNGWRFVPASEPESHIFAFHFPSPPEGLTMVSVDWTFDKDGRLIDVRVHKGIPNA
jgi:hypothetical protein